jgi:endonuclease YncB( thermonuclease family)
MKLSKLFIAAAAIATSVTATAATYSSKVYYWQVMSVVDGDTLSVDGSKDFALPIKVRVKGIDTPEKGSLAKCQGEKNLANRATQQTLMYIQKAKKAGYQISFENIEWDKYGGRVLADVYLAGDSLGDLLVRDGLAKKYTGGKKESWCM